jgi:RNA polymerase sigma factor (sigma-70 family)
MRQILDSPVSGVARNSVATGNIAHGPRTPLRTQGSRARNDDDTLVARVIEIALGNSDALTALYESTASHLHSIARCVLRCPRDTEEIVCDVYVWVWQNSHRYDAGRGTVMRWLSVITRRRAIDRIRRRRHTLSFEDESAHPVSRPLTAATDSPDQFLAQFEDKSRVHRVLALQSPLKRRLIELAFLRGLCHEEIATTTGLRLGTVKSHIRRTLKSMRTTLEIAPLPSRHFAVARSVSAIASAVPCSSIAHSRSSR